MDNSVHIIFPSRERVEQAVQESIKLLFERDEFLLTNDVAERTITGHLCGYLEAQFEGWNVDCEYNRNVESTSTKYKSKQKSLIVQKPQEEEIETYPDIIVHRRGVNTHNLLVIEVKKKTNSDGSEYDSEKLKGFTQQDGANPYHYKHGLFIDCSLAFSVK